ncbi:MULTISPECIES: cob(I)yrinic acid a,c-diamide adenosyltransferase [Sutcliffiella]|uniref:Corrinoid adenosyltransferase n=1 Tax=Sutcliffiella cohnii TaxID=33932 RepID=A0A223KLB5_9BACI|nr:MULTISPECIES: cob(I)yrinic acid a,c-diamide adenosyltransferase [Sutcliffiella]AST90290.1 ATP:cob(I)alamin adenosyltransferase [Sutcliffiella cohnii]MED4018976.1 cob(I)yrinic acid a,c-diamide adenosyltransferase [Sutcliffiella cohnii]WBL15941.1 cob(I)yrinic acid a,c-diamide adenosyltransferase [Sutcliffiella sp. NC1]
MKIYTKTGDKGQTSLVYGSRVPKYDDRVEAYGTCDEANSMIGLAVTYINEEKVFEKKETILETLNSIQTILFHVGAELATPKGKDVRWNLTEEHVKRLEKDIDILSENLPPLKNFILPGGSKAGATLHCARTIVRRAERNAVKIEEGTSEIVLAYLNRLSDYLFVAGRAVNFHLQVEEPELRPEV